MADFNSDAFERRLNRLSETQESIESLSSWTHRYQTLLYLVNDVLQNGRRRGLDFSLAFREVLPTAVAMTRGLKCQASVERIIVVWEERRVYDMAYLRYLRQCLEKGEEFVLSNPLSDVTTTTLEMSSASVAERLETFRNFEATLASKLAKLNSMRLHSWNESMLIAIKDKQEGHQIYEEIDEGVSCLKDCCDTMTSEVEHRRNIIAALEQSLVEQRQEAALTKKLYKEVMQSDSRVSSVLASLRSKLSALSTNQQADKVPALTLPVDGTTASDSSLLSAIQPTGVFLLHSSRTLPTPDGVVHNVQEDQKQSTDTGHVDHIEEEDMDIDDSASEDESHPAKVTKADITSQAASSINGLLIDINATNQENTGTKKETVGQFTGGNGMSANASSPLTENAQPVVGMNTAPFPSTHREDSLGIEGHPPGPQPFVQHQPMNQQFHPLPSPNMMLQPPFLPPSILGNPPMPITSPSQSMPHAGVYNPMGMGPFPGIDAQRYPHPPFRHSVHYRGRGRGRGQGMFQTQPVPSRYY
ncbi:regulation of nuclear pre-mRNA domain-containing protein 2-like isoform X2 [Corticium candelabrum]|uniref:regulation of nuclear pre-mRNA domain-containing protein 2-like isoform X2 n=1 Tax=Corticium candelabrum TaxID=121492 RepID=UPI002E257C2B|nr:regulation of nuclear pre-mRNA domain-containing protein 2-like isoform X2 [Corticium candelabrum]